MTSSERADLASKACEEIRAKAGLKYEWFPCEETHIIHEACAKYKLKPGYIKKLLGCTARETKSNT